MKYCYSCNRITAGEPLFCNSCGRSYNVKLCPRMHPNPRHAQACSRCGSRDLSTPQPKIPWWVPILEVVLSLIPGFFIAILSVTALFFIVTELLKRPAAIFALAMLVAAFWVVWAQIPAWFRTAIYWMLKRKREGDDRRSQS